MLKVNRIHTGCLGLKLERKNDVENKEAGFRFSDIQRDNQSATNLTKMFLIHRNIDTKPEIFLSLDIEDRFTIQRNTKRMIEMLYATCCVQVPILVPAKSSPTEITHHK